MSFVISPLIFMVFSRSSFGSCASVRVAACADSRCIQIFTLLPESKLVGVGVGSVSFNLRQVSGHSLTPPG